MAEATFEQVQAWLDAIEVAAADWKDIAETMAVDKEKGWEKYKSKDSRCNLCPIYKKTLVAEDYVFVSCKECPVVKLTRRSCEYWVMKHKMEKGTEEVPQIVSDFLQKTITEVKKIWAISEK